MAHERRYFYSLGRDIKAYLLESGNELPIVGCSRMNDRHGNVHHRGCHAGTLRLKLHDLDLGEAAVGWGLGYGGKGEEVLSRVVEAGKVAKRSNSPCCILVEQTSRNGARTLLDKL